MNLFKVIKNNIMIFFILIFLIVESFFTFLMYNESINDNNQKIIRLRSIHRLMLKKEELSEYQKYIISQKKYNVQFFMFLFFRVINIIVFVFSFSYIRKYYRKKYIEGVSNEQRINSLLNKTTLIDRIEKYECFKNQFEEKDIKPFSLRILNQLRNDPSLVEYLKFLLEQEKFKR